MRILYLGDVMGRAGRRAITENLNDLKTRLRVDFTIVNGENASHGMGLSGAHAKALLEAGADCITLGDHAFDQKDMLTFIEGEPRIIRPLNIGRNAPGRGAAVYEASRGRRVLVTQALGRVFMRQPFDDPFSALDEELRRHVLGAAVQATVVDIHAEATSEKMGIGHWCDGRASLVVGTHTHIPTADTTILPKGTGFQADLGMCGDYDSVIGMQKAEPMRRFITGMAQERFTPANGPATLSGVLVETDDQSGLATNIWPIRIGGRLSQSLGPDT